MPCRLPALRHPAGLGLLSPYPPPAPQVKGGNRKLITLSRNFLDNIGMGFAYRTQEMQAALQLPGRPVCMDPDPLADPDDIWQVVSPLYGPFVRPAQLPSPPTTSRRPNWHG